MMMKIIELNTDVQINKILILKVDWKVALKNKENLFLGEKRIF